MWCCCTDNYGFACYPICPITKGQHIILSVQSEIHIMSNLTYVDEAQHLWLYTKFHIILTAKKYIVLTSFLTENKL